MSVRGFTALNGGSVLTVGTFDGVHLGHRAILHDLAKCSERLGLPGVVVTFAPHPLAVVNAAAAPKLLTPGPERLIALADDSSPARAVIVPFTGALAGLTA